MMYNKIIDVTQDLLDCVIVGHNNDYEDDILISGFLSFPRKDDIWQEIGIFERKSL